MKNIKALVVMAVISSMALTACQKYEDGPLLSFRSREERIANNWRIEQAINDGNDITGSFDNYEISLTKGGDASLTAQYSFLGVDYDYTTTGTWSLTSDDEKIEVNYDNDLADATYFILRLKEKELWVRQENTNLELHLSPR